MWSGYNSNHEKYPYCVDSTIRLSLIIILQITGIVIFTYFIPKVITKCKTLECYDDVIINITYTEYDEYLLNCTIIFPDLKNHDEIYVILNKSIIETTYGYTWICNPNKIMTGNIEKPIKEIILFCFGLLVFEFTCIFWMVTEIKKNPRIMTKYYSLKMTIKYKNPCRREYMNSVDDLESDDDKDNSLDFFDKIKEIKPNNFDDENF